MQSDHCIKFVLFLTGTSFDFILICLFSNRVDTDFWHSLLSLWRHECTEMWLSQETARGLCHCPSYLAGCLRAEKQISTRNAKKCRNWLNNLSIMYWIQINEKHFNTVLIYIFLTFHLKKKNHSFQFYFYYWLDCHFWSFF